MIKPYTVITLNVPESGQGLELAKRKEKKTLCALDHSAEVKTFRRNVRTNSTLSSIKFFKSPSNHNLSQILQA
jgi:hypothetical protein